MRLSILFSGFGSLGETFQAVRQADKEGLDGVGSAEHLGFHDAVVPSASYLAVTKRLEVGLVGLSTAGRHPGLLAMELMSLSELGPNRYKSPSGNRSSNADKAVRTQNCETPNCDARLRNKLARSVFR